MLRLHNCATHHFWESADDPAVARCPTCGKPAETSPLFFAADELAAEAVVAEVVPVEDDVRVEGYEILERLEDLTPGLRAYRAKQVKTGREVRLDVVVAAEDSTQRAWARLRSQATTAAKLAHPHVPSVYDSGERERRFFYNASEMIAGPTLAERVAKKPVPREVAIDLVEQLARLVAYAHERDVLHRHLEPSCVILQPITPPPPPKGPARDGPGGGVLAIHSGYYLPRIDGWGAARKATDGDLADPDLFDDPGNMAPEQAAGKAQDVGVATDVYGLGAILYFLLTGVAPFRGETMTSVIDAVTTAHLLRPSQLARVPGDLEAVCLKALSRNPRRRYASASEFADDLRRVRTHQEPRCYDGGGGGRVFRWMRRNPAVATGLVTTALGIFVGCGGILFGLGSERTSGPRFTRLQSDLRANQAQLAVAQRQLNELRAKEEAREAAQLVQTARSLLAAENRNDARQALQRVAMKERKFEWHLVNRRLNGDPAFDFGRVPGGYVALAGSPQDKTFATAHTADGRSAITLRRFDPVRRRWQSAGPWNVPEVAAMVFSADGNTLAVVGGETRGRIRLFAVEQFPTFSIRPLQDKEVVARPRGLSLSVDRVGYVVAGATGLVQMLSPSGDPIGTIGADRFRGAEGRQAFAFARADGVIATAHGGEAFFRLLQPDGRSAFRDMALPDAPTAAAMSATNLLAFGTKAGDVRLTDPIGAAANVDLPRLPAEVKHLAFSPDGTRLVAVVADGTARVYSSTAGEWREVADFAATGLSRVEFLASGNTVVGVVGQGLWLWGE